jgi:hypothetical protein
MAKNMIWALKIFCLSRAVVVRKKLYQTSPLQAEKLKFLAQLDVHLRAKVFEQTQLRP